ncbi:RloB family protein [uncultured Corynebacterium sp.]|uniref:RloB family protein n=1 Tax=uncultured Corynebacterium sp. TaxID=159447 RepID=UPI0025FED0DE|nr:RloB family protein [uncultured Corynebacterium sp.]
MCQGVVTEPEYIGRLAQAVRKRNPCFGSKPEDPVKLVEHAAAVAEDRDATRVYVVIDVDDSPREQIEQAISRCRRKSSKKRTLVLVVSNESFDSWLYAHVIDGRVPSGQPRSYFQKKLAGGGYLHGSPAKHLCVDFPVGNWEKAEQRIPTVGLNESGTNPSTAMPALIRDLLSLATK